MKKKPSKADIQKARDLLQGVSDAEKAERTEREALYVGRYFRTANRYSNGDSWWLYMALTGQEDGELMGWTFQETEDGIFEVSSQRRFLAFHFSVTNGRFKEITKKEFDSALAFFRQRMGEVLS